MSVHLNEENTEIYIDAVMFVQKQLTIQTTTTEMDAFCFCIVYTSFSQTYNMSLNCIACVY